MNAILISQLVNFLFPLTCSTFFRYYLFSDRLRWSKRFILISHSVYFILCGFVFVFMQKATPSGHSGLQIYKLFLNIPVFITSFYLIRETIPKQFMFHSIWWVYKLMLLRTVSFIEYHFFGGHIVNADYTVHNIIVILFYAATLPLMALFFRRVIAPAYRLGKPSVWRYIWCVPFTFGLAYCLFVWDTSESGIASVRGMLIMMVVMTGMLFSVYLLRLILSESDKNARLEANVTIAERLLARQREQYARTTENTAQIQRMHHDMRHQLSVIRAKVHEPDALLRYLDDIEAAAPQAKRFYCDNSAVNIIAGQYFSQAEGEGVKLDVRLQIPQDIGRVSEADLCVLIGNILENALEACRFVGLNNRFIRARSKVHNGILSIVVENSYDGFAKEYENQYLSRKRKETSAGVGLSSVQAVCRKYDGLLKIQAEGEVWKTSVLVDMEGRLGGGVEGED